MNESTTAAPTPLSSTMPSIDESLSVWAGFLYSPLRPKDAPRIDSFSFSTVFLWAVLSCTMGCGVQLLWSNRIHFDALLTRWAATPFWLIVWVFFGALWLNIGLWLTGLFNRTQFGITLKIAALAQLSTFWLMVPMVGPMLSALSQLCLILGITSGIYRISRTRVALALILPSILIFVALIAALLFFGGVAAVLIQMINQLNQPAILP